MSTRDMVAVEWNHDACGGLWGTNPSRPLRLQHAKGRYYAEVPALALDEQSRLIEQLIGLAFDALGARHRTSLREGRRAGWYATLFALIAGGASDLVTGALWFGHGSPLYRLLGGQVLGFGWEFLYVYFVAWIAALVISYQPIFGSLAKNNSSEENKLWTSH